jgi:hypothetical protein
LWHVWDLERNGFIVKPGAEANQEAQHQSDTVFPGAMCFQKVLEWHDVSPLEDKTISAGAA